MRSSSHVTQYDFLPAEKVNPWVGYGIGYESTGFSATSTKATVQSPTQPQTTYALADQALHEWLLIGVRFTVNP